jgi:hypothetical protein
MKNLETFIESGILEMYVLGMCSEEEAKEVEAMAGSHDEVRKEVEAISETLKIYAESNSLVPKIDVKAMTLAAIDYEERLKAGETPSSPPILNDRSTLENYSEWLNRKDMKLPDNFDGIYVKLIGYTPEAISGIVWIESETPYEVHTDEYEKFLIVEGACDIIIDGNTHSLVQGNYLSIPLHAGHIVKVTSKTPCKVILQRVAA